MTWNIFTDPVTDYWDFDHYPDGKDIKMVLPLKTWLTMIGALDFNLMEATVNDYWYQWQWCR